MVSKNSLHSGRHARAGLSALEFLGCLLAVLGGAWLGAMYLGIDLHHVAYVALSESDLLEKVPEDWRPEAPADAHGAKTSAELAQAVQNELSSLRGEIVALRTAHESRQTAVTNQVANQTPGATAADAEAQAKQQTIAYWNRVHEIVREQAALQQAAESAASQDGATKLAALKARINRFAASAIRAIPSEGVDRTAHGVSAELADWFERGAGVYDQAVVVWESPARRQDDPIAKEWEFAQMQIKNEGRLLGDKLAAARDALSRQFAHEFAEIAGP
jgi:hypothetical protein